jgi:hypothetical protein
MVRSTTLICGSRDGRIFQFDEDTYELKRVISLHTSWISALAITTDYFATGSFDSSIRVTTSAALSDFTADPTFLIMNEHTDYILAVAISGELLISSSSDLTIRLSCIRPESIRTIRTASLTCSVHSILCQNDTLFLGFANGKLERRPISAPARIDKDRTFPSAVKHFLVLNDHLFVGCLNGAIYRVPLAALQTEGAVFRFESPIVGLLAHKGSVLAVTQTGHVADLLQGGVYNLPRRIVSVQSGHGLHFGCDDGSLVCVNSDQEIVRTAAPALRYIRAVRISHTAAIVCKTSEHSVQLWNALTLEMEIDFGKCSLKEKLSELKNCQNCECPFNLDCKTGRVRIVLEGILPRIYTARMLPQFLDTRRLLQALIEKRSGVFETTAAGKLVWSADASVCLPPWTRFLLLEKFEPKPIEVKPAEEATEPAPLEPAVKDPP